MSDRGMKKWLPFNSLVEQKQYLRQMKQDINKAEPPLLSEDQAEDINNILCNYHGEVAEVHFYKKNKIFSVMGKITKIDQNVHCIVVDNMLINVSTITFLKIF